MKQVAMKLFMKLELLPKSKKIAQSMTRKTQNLLLDACKENGSQTEMKLILSDLWTIISQMKSKFSKKIALEAMKSIMV